MRMTRAAEQRIVHLDLELDRSARRAPSDSLGQKIVDLQNCRGPVSKAKSLEAGIGEQGCVHHPRLHFAQARFDVATQ